MPDPLPNPVPDPVPDPQAHARPASSALAVIRLASVVGGIGLVLLGALCVGLSMLQPSQGAGFVRTAGLALAATGGLGLLHACVRRPAIVRRLLGVATIIASAALAVWVVVLLAQGTLRGPMLVLAPALIVVPTVLQIGAVLIASRSPPGARHG